MSGLITNRRGKTSERDCFGDDHAQNTLKLPKCF